MDSQSRFRLSSPNIVSETFDDEAVIVNLENGNYYSFNSIGAEIWDIIKEGAPVGEPISLLKEKYEENHNNIEDDVHRFLNELKQENLILLLDNTDAPQGKDDVPENTPAKEKVPFTAPTLQKYTDMQELLLLDPIHEVDDSGWPTKKQE